MYYVPEFNVDIFIWSCENFTLTRTNKLIMETTEMRLLTT